MSQHILIVCQDNIGDLVFTSSINCTLAHFQGDGVVLDVLTRDTTSEVVRFLPFIRKAWAVQSLSHVSCWPWSQSFRAFRIILGILADNHYDAAILVGKNWRLGLLCRLAGIPVRVGYAYPKLKPWLTHSLPRPPKSLPVLSALAELVRPLGVEVAEVFPYQLDMKQVAAGVDGLGNQPELQQWSGSRRRLGLHAFAGDSGRCVALPVWISLARHLVDLGWSPVWFGTPGELARLRAMSEVPGQYSDELGDGSLGQSIALLSRCHAYVGHDSGVLHLASAMGVRTLGVFTPGEPQRTFAQGTGGGVTFHRQQPEEVTAASLLESFEQCFLETDF